MWWTGLVTTKLASGEGKAYDQPCHCRSYTAAMTFPFPADVRNFVDCTVWTFAKTYAAAWPHEYVVQNTENAPMILALARHIFEHGTNGRFYSQVRKYHHEGGKVYWSMASTPEAATLINRCNDSQTYEARLSAGTLPERAQRQP